MAFRADTDQSVEFLRASCHGETDRALLIQFETGEKHWMPKSQIDDASEVYAEGQVGTFVCTQWIAEQKGLV